MEVVGSSPTGRWDFFSSLASSAYKQCALKKVKEDAEICSLGETSLMGIKSQNMKLTLFPYLTLNSAFAPQMA